MTGRERIEAALRGQRPDRVPILLHNSMLAAREAGYSMAQYRWDARKIVDSHLRALDTYGHDGILLHVDTIPLADAVGVRVSFPEHAPAYASGEPCLHTLADIDDLPLPDLNNHPHVRTYLDAASILVERVGRDVSIGASCDQAPFSLASTMRTPEKWIVDLLTEGAEPLATYLLEYCTEVARRFVRLVASTGVRIVSNDDSPAGPSMISPDMYRRWALPYEKRLVEEAHRVRCAYVLHVGGNAGKILPDMLATGADGLELDFQTPRAAAREALGDGMTFLGNLDASGVLATGTPDDVRSATSELIEAFADTPRFILSTGCAIPPTTPPENLHAMIHAARDFRA